MALTWATAALMLAPGWKKTLMMARPLMDCDSMCSISLTVVVSDALVNGRDALFHLLGAQAGVVESRGDDRDIDVRKDIGGRAEDDDRRQNQNQQRQHDERVGPRQRKSDNPHLWLLQTSVWPAPK